MKPAHLVSAAAILFVCIVFLTEYIRYRRLMNVAKEGFQPVQGTFPRAKQSSFIPSDSAGATTANPLLAKPDVRDFVDANDSFQYFLDIYSPVSANATGKTGAIQAMLRLAPAAQAAIQQFIKKPETIPSREVLDQAAEARQLADAMRRVGAADPIGVEWPRPGCISYRDDNLMAI